MNDGNLTGLAELIKPAFRDAPLTEDRARSANHRSVDVQKESSATGGMSPERPGIFLGCALLFPRAAAVTSWLEDEGDVNHFLFLARRYLPWCQFFPAAGLGRRSTNLMVAKRGIDTPAVASHTLSPSIRW